MLSARFKVNVNVAAMIVATDPHRIGAASIYPLSLDPGGWLPAECSFISLLVSGFSVDMKGNFDSATT